MSQKNDDKWDNIFSSGRSFGERPKLNLAPRSLPTEAVQDNAEPSTDAVKTGASGATKDKWDNIFSKPSFREPESRRGGFEESRFGGS